MTDQPIRDPHEGVNPAAVPEFDETDRTDIRTRSSNTGGGPTTPGTRPGTEQPGYEVSGGVADGNPVAGAEISDADRDAAVPGDTGPLNAGDRR